MTFNGFISYSHAADGRLAPAVQRGLQRLAKPWHQRRALSIFRDQTGLAVTLTLWSSIQSALDDSDYFVLLASPGAARSPWVNREITHWTVTRPATRILAVVTDGEWQWDPARDDFTPGSTAVPAALRGVFTEEPKFLDLRWAQDPKQLNLRHARFREAIAQLAAPMHGMNMDDLVGEDLRQHRRVRQLRFGAVAALVLLTGLAVVTGLVAYRNAGRANAALAETRHQQQVAQQRRAEAERSSLEAARQQDLAQQAGTRAQAATDEARRQEQLARDQKALADQAAVEAGRLQAYAQRQQNLANAAAAAAQQRRREAEQLAVEARRQQAKAEEQRAKAEEQRRIAISRRLFNQSTALISEDPKTAMMVGVAASQVQPDVESRRQLTGVLTSMRYAGSLAGQSGGAFGAGEVLATGAFDDGTVSLWNVADRAHPVRLSTLPGSAWAATQPFSPDGRTLLTADAGRRAAVLWNVSNPARPQRIATLPANIDVSSAALSADGRTMATSDDDGTGMLWDVTDPAHPRPVATLSDDSGPLGLVLLSADGRTLMTDAGTVNLWDLTDRTHPARVGTLSRDGLNVTSMAVGADPHLLATGGADGSLLVWNITDPAQPLAVGGSVVPGPFITSVAFGPRGQSLVTGDSSGLIALWDLEEGWNVTRRGSVSPPGGVIDSAVGAAFSPDGSTLLAAGGGRPLTLWSTTPYGTPRPYPLTDRYESAQLAMFSPDGRSLLTTGDRTATFWDMNRPARPVRRTTVSLGPGSVGAKAFSPDLRTAAVVTGGRVTLTDLTHPDRPRALATIPADDTSGLAFGPRGRTLAVIGGSTVTLWSLADRAHPARRATLPMGGSVRLSPDEQTVAVSGDDIGATLWSVSGRLLATLPDPARARVMAFSPDGHLLVIANESPTAQLRDVADPVRPRRITTLTGLGEPVQSAVFSADGRTLLTGGSLVARLWDITDPVGLVRVATLYGADFRNGVVAFSPDGNTLAAGTTTTLNDGPLMLWDATALNRLRADPAGVGCTVAGRGLNAEEWSRFVPDLPYRRTC